MFVCLPVRPSVCPSRSCILPKRINISSNLPSGSHTILAFPYQTPWQYRRGRQMQVGYKKIAIFDQYVASSRAVNVATARCNQHGSAGPWQVVTLTAGSKRRGLLMAEDDDEMFMTRSLNVTPKTTEQHLIVRSGKSETELTNDKRLCSRYCTDRHEASHDLSATAELFVYY